MHYPNTKYQFLKLIMEGKIERRGKKKIFVVQKHKDSTGLDAHILFRIDCEEYFRMGFLPLIARC